MLLPYDPLCQKIQTRSKLSRELSGIPRHRWFKRRELRRRIADLSSGITDQRVLKLADEIMSKVWSKAASTVIPKKNAYGPAAEGRFNDILNEAVELCQKYEVYDGECSFPLDELPEINGLVTKECIEQKVRPVIEERAKIAASSKLIREYAKNVHGQQTLIIQHIESGLRAEFTMNGQGFGSVDSKSYTLYSIDDNNPGMHVDWESVVGLGIGRRIYEEAHRMQPTIRWGAGMLTPYSRALRQKLHAADPYIWDGPCEWCNANLPVLGVNHWMNATPASFSSHP